MEPAMAVKMITQNSSLEEAGVVVGTMIGKKSRLYYFLKARSEVIYRQLGWKKGEETFFFRL